MTRKLSRTDHKTIRALICKYLSMEQRCRFDECDPETIRQLIDHWWHENIKLFDQWFMKKEKEGAANGQTKLIHREPWVN
jgi:hypothetical protein